MSRGKAVPVLVLLLSAFAAPASAQYFGQNKVQYHQFDFQVLKTDHFDIYYYPEEQAAVTIAARMAERWYTRLSTVLHHQLSTRQPIILYAAHTHFEQTNILEGLIPEGTGGVTEGVRRRMILPFAGGLAETDHVLGHEMVHAFQYDMASRRASGGREAAIGVSNLPLWFIEGMAEYLSLGPVDANTAMWIRDASSRDKMPSVDKLSDPTFFPYRYGQAFWAYVAGRWGDQAIGDLLRATGPGGDIDAAMKTVLGEDKKTFTKDWHDATHMAYAPFFETTGKPEAFGRPLVTSTTTGGDMNVAPALSPDGRRVVFLSSRSQVAIDMYVADVATGTVTKKLVETAGDPHFESLQFIDSAGDWAPDNRRFVFSGVAKGQPVLSFIDVDSGHRVDERAFPSLDQIFNPAWSPDGHRIAFSGFKGGLLDLYVYDLDSKALTQLTSDAYADYDPEWSPDGKSLAWVTDRFTSNLDTLDFGSYRIGLIDVQTHQARPLAGFDTGRNTNPEFSADGRSLYFIGAPNGIPNVYRVDVADASHPVAITNVLSGVSGITPLTPALSVASAAPGLVFSVYQDNDYNLYAAKAPIRPVAASDVARDAAALPPFPRRTDQIATLLNTPTEALPPRTTYPSSDYRARLSLDQVGQPAIGIGADPFGTYVGGGVSFLWSDMLGNHELGTTVYTSSRLEDTGGAVMYLNRVHRWNWGFVGERTPYVTGSFGQSLVAQGGQVAVVQQQQFITQTNNAATGIVQYPFSRAQRIELSAGLQHIGFTERLETQTFDPFTGQLLDRQTETHSIAQGLNLAAGTGALVYDSSVFGATSPILGQRYRLELSQVAGSITYSGVLADYRRYFMPARPFTVALRGLHYGRYGAGGEDPRLSPLFLGYPGLVRGYDVNSFDPGECVGDGTSGCTSFDRLIGSRMLVANAELRFPLVGLFNRHELYGPVPIELALFGDAGLAWSSTDTTSLGAPLSNREWARSVGAAVRVNLLGFAVGELDYVHPLDRPGRGWLWQFNLMPGF